MLVTVGGLLLWSVVKLDPVESACGTSYLTKCDSLKDMLIEDAAKKITWRELLIEPIKRDHVPEDTLTEEHAECFPNLERLVIVQQLIEINDTFLISLADYHKIKYIIFYGNNLPVLKGSTFIHGAPNLTILRLGLENNNVQEIEPETFNADGQITTVDLSHNKLTILRNGTFIYCMVTEVILRHNQLSHIERGALNANLKILNLDHNNLYHVPSSQLRDLRQLTDLTLSHNRLSQLEDLSALVSLNFLDVSYNNLYFIGDELDNVRSLRYLSLENNNLESFSLPLFTTELVNETTFFLSLVKNRLSRLDLQHFSRKAHLVLHLAGNPWNCDCFFKMEAFMSKNSMPIRISDGHLMQSGKIPFCVNELDSREDCSERSVSEQTINILRKTVDSASQTCWNLFFKIED